VGNYSNGTGSGTSTLSRSLIESWNGSTWSIVPGPSPSVAYLYGVSCISARSCKAVGDYASSLGAFWALVESFNGTTWSIVPGPRPSVAYLYGVSCVSTRSCKAVGEHANSSGVVRTLVESWNGTAWTVRPKSQAD
jgi:hypothetical protein